MNVLRYGFYDTKYNLAQLAKGILSGILKGTKQVLLWVVQ